MDNLVLLLACLAIGVILRRSGRLPDDAHVSLNGFIIHVSLPALTLFSVHGLEVDRGMIALAAMAWILFGLGFAFFSWLGRVMKLSPQTTGALILTGSLANTSFVGVPMLEAYFGSSAVGMGLFIDQAGTYLVLSTLGLLVAAIHSQGGRPSARLVLRRVFTFPPFLAFVAALLLTPVAYPSWVQALLDRLGGTLVPLALVSVGYQIRAGQIRGRLRELALGLTFKLLAAPILIALIYAGMFGGRGEMVQVTIFEAAMPPQIGAAIVAMDHKLDCQLVTLMVGVGIPLSFLTLYIWRQALHFLA